MVQKHSSTDRYSKGLILVHGLALSFSLAMAVTGSALTIAWDRNLETNVVAYVVYYGQTSNVYTGSTNVGNVTQVSLENLPFGHWFLAVTAVTDAGEESDYSAPLPIDLGPPEPSGTNVLCPSFFLGCSASFTITMPAGVSGASMNYEMPTFVDPCDPHPVVTCVPPRGSRFALGTTPVVCTAVDILGIVKECSFNITFKQVSQIPPLNIRLLGASGPSIELWWTGAGNEQFHLEEAEVMAGAGGAFNWTPVTTPAPDVNGLCRVTNSPSLSGGSARFFRLSNSQ